MLIECVDVHIVGRLRSAGAIAKVHDSLIVAISRKVGIVHRLKREPFVLGVFFTIHHEARSFRKVRAVE